MGTQLGSKETQPLLSSSVSSNPREGLCKVNKEMSSTLTGRIVIKRWGWGGNFNQGHGSGKEILTLTAGG